MWTCKGAQRVLLAWRRCPCCLVSSFAVSYKTLWADIALQLLWNYTDTAYEVATDPTHQNRFCSCRLSHMFIGHCMRWLLCADLDLGYENYCLHRTAPLNQVVQGRFEACQIISKKTNKQTNLGNIITIMVFFLLLVQTNRQFVYCECFCAHPSERFFWTKNQHSCSTSILLQQPSEWMSAARGRWHLAVLPSFYCASAVAIAKILILSHWRTSLKK